MKKLRKAQQRIREMETTYNQRQSQLTLLEKQKTELETRIASVKDKKLHEEKVASLLVSTADEAREAGRKRMEKVVTKALQSVFGQEFTFEIELDESGGKPIANFYVVSPNDKGELIRNEPQTSRGGGVNDIVAFALQVATMVVYNEPKIQGPIVLDEPGKHVSDEYVVKFGEFLEFISKTFNRQIFMVTHQPHLAMTADKTLTSQLIGGKTVIKEQDDDEFEKLQIQDKEDENA